MFHHGALPYGSINCIRFKGSGLYPLSAQHVADQLRNHAGAPLAKKIIKRLKGFCKYTLSRCFKKGCSYDTIEYREPLIGAGIRKVFIRDFVAEDTVNPPLVADNNRHNADADAEHNLERQR